MACCRGDGGYDEDDDDEGSDDDDDGYDRDDDVMTGMKWWRCHKNRFDEWYSWVNSRRKQFHGCIQIEGKKAHMP